MSACQHTPLPAWLLREREAQAQEARIRARARRRRLRIVSTGTVVYVVCNVWLAVLVGQMGKWYGYIVAVALIFGITFQVMNWIKEWKRS